MKKKSVFLVITVVMTAVFILSGCGGSGSSGSTKTSHTAITPKINVDDIDWKVESGIYQGEHMPLLSFTNNTNCDIVSLEIDYVTDSDVSDDDLKSNAAIRNKAKDMEHDISETTVEASAEKYVPEGESAEGFPVNFDGTIEYLTDNFAMKFFKPDKMSVGYISGKKLYMAYYDFNDKKTSYDSKSINVGSWSDSSLAKTVEEPDSDIFVVSEDSEDSFNASVYDYSSDDFKSYADACREKGYTKNVSDYDDWFSAENKDGKSLDLTYDSNGKCMTISVY